MEHQKPPHLYLVSSLPQSIVLEDRPYHHVLISRRSLAIGTILSGLMGFPGNQSLNHGFSYMPTTQELLTSCIHNGESEGFVNDAQQGYTEIYCSKNRILHYIHATKTLLTLSHDQE